MGYSISIVFDRRGTATHEKNGSVEICVYSKGRRKVFSTGVHVKKHEWRKGIVVGRLDASVLNAQIQRKYQDIVSLANQDEFDFSRINVVNLGTVNVCDWIEQRIKMRADIAERTRKSHRVMLKALRESGLFRTFEDFTPKNLKLFDDFLRQKGTLTKQTAIHNYHKCLKAYLNIALQLELIMRNPYMLFSSPKGESSGIKYLTEEERTRIELLEIDGTLAIVRDMFIFACYTGLADADLRRVAKEDIVEEGGKRFIIDRRKKTGSPYKLMLLPKALEILERYDYDLDRFTNQKCNQYLKAIQAMAGIRTRLTMHVASHSISSFALKTNDLQNLNLRQVTI